MTFDDDNTSIGRYAYSRLMQRRVLSKQEYTEYLARKERSRSFHKSLEDTTIDFDNPMISSDYYLPDYSDMLLFGHVPDKAGFNKSWGYIR